MVANAEMQKKLEILGQGSVVDRVQRLEEEKNALLDYIEEQFAKGGS